MIYLLYGSDTYRSRKKLNEIIASYREKNAGCFDFHRLDAEENNLASLQNLLGLPSLFSRKKLAVIENIFSEKCNFSALAGSAERFRESKNVFIILWGRESEKDSVEKIKMLGLPKSNAQEFKNLSGAELNRWIGGEARKMGIRLAPAQGEYLRRFGGDLWAVSNELAKIQVSSEEGLNKQEFQEKTIFDLGDTFFSSPKIGLGNLLQFLRQGEDEFKTFGYLAGHNRTLLIVKSYLEKGRMVPPSAGLHPYVVKKASSAARNLNPEQLSAQFKKFFEEDGKIKTGRTTPKESLVQILISNLLSSDQLAGRTP